jgi:DNA-binding transcriptional MerR regulator
MMNNTIEIEGRTYVSTHTLAARFNVHSMTIARWVQRNLLPKPIKIGNMRYFDAERVETSMARGE